MSRLSLRLVALTLAMCLVAGAAGAETLRGYQKEKPNYQYVQLGTYPTEADGTVKPVLWRVLGVENGQAILLSELILDVQQVIFCDNQRIAQETHAFRRITDYADSDLCPWMNDVMLTTLLGGDALLDALVETHYGKLYPPLDEWMLNRAYGFTNARYGDEYIGYPEKRAKATDYAKSIKLFPDWNTRNLSLYVFPDFGTSPYWCVGFQSVSNDCIKFSLCGYNGHMSYGVYTRINVGLRPALTLDLSRCQVASGTGTQEDPFLLALTDTAAE